MRATWSTTTGLAGALLCLGVLSACGDDVVVDDQPTATAYDGPLDIKVSYADDADVMERSGSAGLALECAGTPSNGGGADYDSGLASTQSSAERAVENWMKEEGNWFGGLPRAGYQVERDDGDRVLLSLDVDGESKATIIVGNAIEDWKNKTDWGVESWAMCDPSEFPPSFDDELGVQVWQRPDGSRVPLSLVSSFPGAEHCDWQDITFLTLGDGKDARQFVRDEEGIFEDLESTYTAGAQLPEDAVDSGFERDGRHLWTAADDSAAYLVSIDEPHDVERWPGAIEPIYCA